MFVDRILRPSSFGFACFFNYATVIKSRVLFFISIATLSSKIVFNNSTIFVKLWQSGIQRFSSCYSLLTMIFPSLLFHTSSWLLISFWSKILSNNSISWKTRASCWRSRSCGIVWFWNGIANLAIFEPSCVEEDIVIPLGFFKNIRYESLNELIFRCIVFPSLCFELPRSAEDIISTSIPLSSLWGPKYLWCRVVPLIFTLLLYVLTMLNYIPIGVFDYLCFLRHLFAWEWGRILSSTVKWHGDTVIHLDGTRWLCTRCSPIRKFFSVFTSPLKFYVSWGIMTCLYKLRSLYWIFWEIISISCSILSSNFAWIDLRLMHKRLVNFYTSLSFVIISFIFTWIMSRSRTMITRWNNWICVPNRVNHLTFGFPIFMWYVIGFNRCTIMIRATLQPKNSFLLKLRFLFHLVSMVTEISFLAGLKLYFTYTFDWAFHFFCFHWLGRSGF